MPHWGYLIGNYQIQTDGARRKYRQGHLLGFTGEKGQSPSVLKAE